MHLSSSMTATWPLQNSCFSSSVGLRSRWRSAASTSQSVSTLFFAIAAKEATMLVFPVPPFPLSTTTSFTCSILDWSLLCPWPALGSPVAATRAPASTGSRVRAVWFLKSGAVACSSARYLSSSRRSCSVSRRHLPTRPAPNGRSPGRCRYPVVVVCTRGSSPPGAPRHR